jgi:hypothetical protein
MRRFAPAAIAALVLVLPSLAAQTVYKTKTGDRYHTSSCRYLAKSKIAIDVAKAKKEGLSACKVCKH